MSRSYSPDDIYVSRDAVQTDTRRDRQAQPGDQRTDMGGSGAEQNHDRSGAAQDGRATPSRTIDARRPYQAEDRTFILRTSEIETMADIGKFRAIGAKDLEEFAYAGDRKHLEADLANLRKQGLIAEQKVPRHETRPRRLIALTKEGRRVLAATNTVPKSQALYYGFTKPREAHHDADLYRLYQRGMERVHREGGTSVRVVLDAELMRNLHRDSARAKQEGEADRTQRAVAEKHGLLVVSGKIPVPDLRIEYETLDHEPARLDLELATEHYRAGTIAQKARAGFSIYARTEDASTVRRILDQQELTAKILQL